MKILKKINFDIILKVLSDGGLVIFPSDTVYGALVNAKDYQAVSKLIEFKNRPPGKPISVFVSDLKMAKQYVSFNNNQLTTLKQLIPGPFTFILPSKKKVDRRLESEKETLGIRIPQFEPVINLVKKFGYPLTATSANLGGRPPSHSIENLLRQLPEKKRKLIDLVVDFGQLPRNKPSTVIDLSEEKIRFLRQGDVQFINSQTFISDSPSSTKKVAQFLINKFLSLNLKKLLIFIIQGELGVGKTVFVKGAAETLGINNVISPTFVIYYEYDIKPDVINFNFRNRKLDQLKKLIHIDLYNIQDNEEFEALKLDQLLKEENLIMIEWGEKIAPVYDLLKKKGTIVYLKMEYLNEKQRKILVNYD